MELPEAVFFEGFFEGGVAAEIHLRNEGGGEAVPDDGFVLGGEAFFDPAGEAVFEGEPKPDSWFNIMQAVDPAPYRGKKVRVSGWIRTDGRKGFRAGLWVRVDRKNEMGFFDNMMNRSITGTEWTEAVVEGLVADLGVTPPKLWHAGPQRSRCEE